jgi:hypothetical protein
MPNPSFLPLIASSFDRLGEEQARWAGFNANIEQANISRANAAEENVNSWLRNVAVAQQAQADRESAQRNRDVQSATALAIRKQNLALDERDKALGLQYEKDRLATEDRRTQAMTERYMLQDAAKQREAQDKIEREGSTAASRLAVAKRNAEQAAKVHKATEENLERATNQIEQERNSKKPNLVAIGNLQRQIQIYTKRLDQDARERNRAENTYDNVRLNLENSGFKIEEDQISHPQSGKSWRFSDILKQAQEAQSPVLQTGEGDVSVNPASLSPWASAFSGFGGMGDGTPGTNPGMALPMVATAPGMIRAGKYTGVPVQ